MATQITIIYITDNSVCAPIAEACRKNLMTAAAGRGIVSVSQKPLNFGENVCVGPVGRSCLNMDRQILAGLEQAKTKFIAIAEHDCLYTEEHFDWIPPDSKYFWYNTNNWLLQYHSDNHPEYDGMFSYVPGRCVQSQLITGRDAMLRATEQKIAILSHPDVQEVWPSKARLGEPGTDWEKRSRRIFNNPKLRKQWDKVKEYITTCNARMFKTYIPNIDIRHGNNFTGGRRGTKRRWELEPWGKMEDILNG